MPSNCGLTSLLNDMSNGASSILLALALVINGYLKGLITPEL